MSSTSKAAAVLLVVFGTLIAWLAFPHLRENTRRPERHLAPAGFEGVLLTVYDEPGYPSLPVQEGFYIHRYPADGILITSSTQEFGSAKDEFLDFLPDGTYAPFQSSLKGPLFEATGSYGSSMDGPAKIEYAAKLAGTKAFWANRSADEVQRAIAIARERIGKVAK